MHAVATTESLLERYRLVGLAVAVIAVVGIIYWQTFSRMVGMWELRTYQHGWLVYPVALLVLWWQREALARVRLHSSWLGSAATAIVLLAWVLSRAAGVQVVEFASATLLIPAAYWALAGREALRRAAFPLLLLLTAVPVGEFLVEPLMLVTAEIASALLHLAGVPVIRDGQFFMLPGGSFEVADVCSGLRYLLAGIMASLAFAYVTYAHWAKRTLLIAIAAVALVVTNGVRAFIVMAVASATDMQVLGGEDHIIFGMFLFAAVFVGLVWIGERYADRQEPGRVDGDTPAPAEGARWPAPAMIVAVLVLLAAGPASQALTRGAAPVEASALSLPSFDGCTGPTDWDPDWSPQYAGADQTVSGSYDCGGYRASVWVASYTRQEQGHELVSSVNQVWPKEWRRYTAEHSLTANLRDDPVDLREVVVDGPTGKRRIWYWYQVGEHATGSEIRVKLLEVADALRLRSRRASVFVIALEPDDNSEGLRARLQAKAETLMAARLAQAE